MTWTKQLYDTYENNYQSNKDMIPISHLYLDVQVEITLDKFGNFISARVLGKDEDSKTIIPVTESSAGRSSGSAPHALSDKLTYVAGDFYQYISKDKTSNKAKKEEAVHIGHFNDYYEQLKRWNNSEYSNLKIQAIFKYISKKNMINDLINSNIIVLEDGTFSNQKINGKQYKDVMVRFIVLDNMECIKTWEDTKLIQDYINYYENYSDFTHGIDYVTGNETIISINHPKGIVTGEYGAKLISANDEQNFSYRGRFLDSSEAYSLGYIESQKIHNALKWLISKQGVKNYGGRTFICWNSNNKQIPDILDLFGFQDEEPNLDYLKYKEWLHNFISGQKIIYDENEQINIIALEAATPGRVSITYYNEISADDFFTKLNNWCLSLNWYYGYGEYKKIKTPNFKEIVNKSFGTERNGFITADEKVLRDQIQRLLNCMMNGTLFPRDIMIALVNNCNNRTKYSNNNWDNLLSTTCSVIIKFYKDHNLIKEDDDKIMKLDTSNNDRNYLFGRLLAVYEKIEKSTYERSEDRDTNAMRIQSAFVNHPMKSWQVLEDVIQPYFSRLTPGSREYYKRIISEIAQTFNEQDVKLMNQPLKETYLLGYYLQRAELSKQNKGE